MGTAPLTACPDQLKNPIIHLPHSIPNHQSQISKPQPYILNPLCHHPTHQRALLTQASTIHPKPLLLSPTHQIRYYYKWPGSPANRWDVRDVVEASWKDVCKVMMEQYTERTTGTLIESDKVACITWHYGTAHQDWARMQVCFSQSHCLLTSFWCEVGGSKISDRGGTRVFAFRGS